MLILDSGIIFLSLLRALEYKTKKLINKINTYLKVSVEVQFIFKQSNIKYIYTSCSNFMFVCLFGCIIITQEHYDQFASHFHWGTRYQPRRDNTLNDSNTFKPFNEKNVLVVIFINMKTIKNLFILGRTY